MVKTEIGPVVIPAQAGIQSHCHYFAGGAPPWELFKGLGSGVSVFRFMRVRVVNEDFAERRA